VVEVVLLITVEIVVEQEDQVEVVLEDQVILLMS
jgi:hypothetical protein